MFKNIIVRPPCRQMVNGISNANLGKPVYEIALKQHREYIRTMEKCGVQVHSLPADESYPDSTFIEDTAVLTEKMAIITNPGADSRKGEELAVANKLGEFYNRVHRIQAPGSCEGGDVMRVADHFYIGLSERTNAEGTEQFIAILEQYGYTGSSVEMSEMLHLKTGLSYLENKNLLITGEFLSNPVFNQFNRLIVPSEESYAANSIWVNDTVIVPAGFPKTQKMISEAGYMVLTVELSEFQKLDGGLSCLSLRF